MELGYNSLSNLAKIKKNIRRKRISSYDRKGANNDFKLINSKEKIEICNISGSGIIKHIWITLRVKDEDPYYLRKVIIRMWWDNELNPSVECPIGDFFGVGHAKSINFWSLPLSMGPQDGKGFNCFWSMPFSQQAKIEIENETDTTLIFYYYIDYEEHNELDLSYGRFHAYWNRENPCEGNDYSLKKAQRWQKKIKIMKRIILYLMQKEKDIMLDAI